VNDVLTSAPAMVPVETVLICDERPIAGQFLTRLLTAGSSFHVVGAVPDGFGLVDAFAARPADLVLIGVHRGTTSGTDAMALLLGLHPAAAVIVFGSPADAPVLAAALTRGARGLMIWDTDHRHRPGTPDGWAIPRLGDGSWRPGAGGAAPTERELQILRGMSQGRSNGGIGRDLFLSEDTVKTHARRLFDKLGARDRAHAVALGLRHGLLT